MGFSFSGSAPNQGLIFAALKPFDERAGGRAPPAGGAEPAARPAVRHPGRDRDPLRAAVDQRPRRVRRLHLRGARPDRRPTSTTWRAATQALIGAAVAVAARGRASSARSRRTTRSCRWTSTARRRGAWACRSSEITSAMQIYLGSAYVNDFDFNNRAYRVYVQADKAFRSDPQHLGQYYARTDERRDGAARERRARAGDDGAAGDQPLQPVPVGGNQRRRRARRQLGAGDPGDGAARGTRAAAGLRLRVVGAVARGDQGRPPVASRSSASACCSST